MASRIERLERLDELRGMGAITDAEFEAQKAKLLGSSRSAVVEQAQYPSHDRVDSHAAYQPQVEQWDRSSSRRMLPSSVKPIIVAILFLVVIVSGYVFTRHTSSSSLRVGQEATSGSANIPEIGSQPVAFVEGDPNSTAAMVISGLFNQGAKCFASTSLGVTTDRYEIDASEGTVLAHANGLWPDRFFDFKLVADQLKLKPREKYDSNVDLVKFKSVSRDGKIYKISGIIGDSSVLSVIFDCLV